MYIEENATVAITMKTLSLILALDVERSDLLHIADLLALVHAVTLIRRETNVTLPKKPNTITSVRANEAI